MMPARILSLVGGLAALLSLQSWLRRNMSTDTR